MVTTRRSAPARRRRLLPLLASLVVVLAACAAETEPSAQPESARSAATTTCAETGSDTASLSEWTDAPTVSDDVVAVIVSSQVGVGPSRFLYTITDPGFSIIASAETPTQLRLIPLDDQAGLPAVEAEGDFLDTGTGRGLYRANVDFPCSGMWGAEVLAQPSAGEPMVARTVFRVTDGGSTPAIGAPAPRSENLTASTVEELQKISTDPEPQLDAYRSTIRDAVTSGKPSVVFFATPAFCQSGVCGPTVEMVKAVVGEYRADVEYVTIEPYKLRDTANGLQPDLDAEGRLQPVQAVVDYGIAVEPYLFVVDADGNVAAKFEVVVDEDELRGALEDVTRSSAAAAAPA